MARVISNVNFLTWGTAVASIVTATPFTFAAWFTTTNTGADQMLFCCSQGGSNINNTFYLWVPTATKLITAVTEQSGAQGVADDGGTAISLSTWYHAAGVFASATSRTAYRNGVPGAQNTVSKTPPGLVLTQLGYSPASRPLIGTMAFPAIWNIDLSPSDIGSLAAGRHPRKIRPANLIACVDMSGGASPEPDLVSATTWTLTGTPSVGVNPRIYR